LEQKRLVSSEEAAQLASSLGTGCEYMETSAKLNQGVDAVFERIAELMERNGHAGEVKKESRRRGGRCSMM
jgi:GTPase SAR1 family protein